MAFIEKRPAVQTLINLGEIRAVLLEMSGTNPLSKNAVDDLNAACDAVDDISGGRALILQLNGQEGLMSGLSWPGAVDLQLVSQWERALRRIESIDGRTVAVVSKQCHAMALEVLLTADYRIGTSDMCLQLSGRGEMMWPGMCVHRLVGSIGLNASRQLVMRGGEISGAWSADIGILDETIEELGDLRRVIAEQLKAVAGGGHSLRRQLLLEGLSSTYEDALGMHLAACDRELRQRQPGVDSSTPLGNFDAPDLV